MKNNSEMDVDEKGEVRIQVKNKKSVNSRSSSIDKLSDLRESINIKVVQIARESIAGIGLVLGRKMSVQEVSHFDANVLKNRESEMNS